MQHLLTLPLNRKRDVLVARQRARQIAALLRFEMQEQACIAAGTFAVAAQAVRQPGAFQLVIQIADKTLHVFTAARSGRRSARLAAMETPQSETMLRLAKPLPGGAADLAAEDLAWVVQQIANDKDFRLFDEIQQQNQEMLALLHALHAAQTRERQTVGNQTAA